MCEHKRKYEVGEGFYCDVCDDFVDMNEYGYDQSIIRCNELKEQNKELITMLQEVRDMCLPEWEIGQRITALLKKYGE